MKISMKSLIQALMLMLLAMSAWAQPPVQPAAWSEDLETRYRSLINELRCLVCQNQTIADSNAPLALDLRNQVQQQLAAGRNEDQIRAYLTDRYGDFVLYKPPLRSRTVALWIGPFVLLGVALIAAYRFARRSRAPAAEKTALADAAAVQRLLDEEDQRS